MLFGKNENKKKEERQMKRKRALRALLSIALIFTMLAQLGVPVVAYATEADGDGNEATVQYGDVDSDGKISAGDARIALRASVGLESLNYLQRTLADTDNNGKITAGDATQILRYSVGLD